MSDPAIDGPFMGGLGGRNNPSEVANSSVDYFLWLLNESRYD